MQDLKHKWFSAVSVSVGPAFSSSHGLCERAASRSLPVDVQEPRDLSSCPEQCLEPVPRCHGPSARVHAHTHTALY